MTATDSTKKPTRIFNRLQLVAIGTLVATCAIAITIISASIYDYQVKMMDLNAPTIPMHHLPVPPLSKPHPAIQQRPQFIPPCYSTDDSCKARELVFI